MARLQYKTLIVFPGFWAFPRWLPDLFKNVDWAGCERDGAERGELYAGRGYSSKFLRIVVLYIILPLPPRVSYSYLVRYFFSVN